MTNCTKCAIIISGPQQNSHHCLGPILLRKRKCGLTPAFFLLNELTWGDFDPEIIQPNMPVISRIYKYEKQYRGYFHGMLVELIRQ